MSILNVGALTFGAVIGWNLYLINRYRSGEVQLTDLVTLIGAVGGAAILAIFPASSVLFGWYGVGLAAGFFGYFAVLLIMVSRSSGFFDVTWFLDGRRKAAPDGWIAGQTSVQRPLDARPGPAPIR